MSTDIPPPLEEVDDVPSPKDLGYKVIDNPYVDITGFEYVRNDSSELTGVLQKVLFDVLLHQPMSEDKAWKKVDDEFHELSDEAQEKVVTGLTSDADEEEIEMIIDQIREDVLKGKYPVLFTCRGPSVNAVEDIHEEYKQPPIAARCGHFTNKFFESVNIQAGDDVYYVYVKSTGYNHQGRKLPENDQLGMVEAMDPPQAKVICNECDHEWTKNDFGKRIKLNSECPECGHSYDDTLGDDNPFDIDGCFADWEKIAEKGVENKARKLLKHVGQEHILDNLGRQAGFSQFK